MTRVRSLLKQRVREFFKRDPELIDEVVNSGLDEPIVDLLDALEATEKLFIIQKERKSLRYYFVEAELVDARERNRKAMGKVVFALLKKWAEEP